MTAPPTDVFQIEPSVAEFAVSKRAYLEARPEVSFAYIATSALVLDNSGSAPRVLLLQRAASDSSPNRWEPPGGACDDEDSSILRAAARELREETGLQAAQIGGPVGDSHFFTLSNGGIVCQFNFAVHVSGEEGTNLTVKLDPNEHQNLVWATEDEVRARKSGNVDLHFTRGEVERTVLSAFNHAQRRTA